MTTSYFQPNLKTKYIKKKKKQTNITLFFVFFFLYTTHTRVCVYILGITHKYI